MATQKVNPLDGAGTWIFGKLAEKVIDHWPQVLAAVSGGGLMTYLAAVSAWLEPYGPVALGAVGLLTVLLLTLSYLAYAMARGQLTRANLMALKASTSKGNILAPQHEYERLDLGDFFLPGMMKVKDKQFRNCHLHGPLSIVIVSADVKLTPVGQIYFGVDMLCRVAHWIAGPLSCAMS